MPSYTTLPQMSEVIPLEGRVPELAHTLLFQPLAPIPPSADSLFLALGTTRQNVVRIISSELEKQNQKNGSYFGSSKFEQNFKRVFWGDILQALQHKQITFVESWENSRIQHHIESIDKKQKRLADIASRYGFHMSDPTVYWILRHEILKSLENKEKRSWQHGSSRFSAKISDDISFLRDICRPYYSTRNSDQRRSCGSVYEKWDLDGYQVNDWNFSDDINQLFETYLTQLGETVPLGIDSALHYATILKENLYLWELPIHASRALRLRGYVLPRKDLLHAMHILIGQRGECYQLNLINTPISELQPSVLDEKEIPISSSVLSSSATLMADDEGLMASLEWTEANVIAGIPEFLKSGTQKTLAHEINELTPFPLNIAQIIQDYTDNIDLAAYLVEQDVHPNLFWVSVINRFSITECDQFFTGNQYNQEFKYKGLAPPTLSEIAVIISTAQHGGQKTIASLEAWVMAILCHHMQCRKALESSKPTPLFCLRPQAIYASNNTRYLSWLELLKNNLSCEMLDDPAIAVMVDYYPRLQYIFLEELLRNYSREWTSERIRQISYWIPSVSLLPEHTLSPFQLIRLVSSILLDNVPNESMHLQLAQPIIVFLENHLPADMLSLMSSNPVAFLHKLCTVHTHRFLPSYCTGPYTENSFLVPAEWLGATKDYNHRDMALKGYCLRDDQVADWYVIAQYLLIGATVNGSILCRFAAKGHTQSMRLLLEVPTADVNAHDGKDTAFMYAIAGDHTAIVDRLLLDPLIDVNRGDGPHGSIDDSNYDAMNVAVIHDRLDQIDRLLCIPGINVAAQYGEGTQQYSSYFDSNNDCVRYSSRYDPGTNALERAIKSKRYAIIQHMMLSKRFSVDRWLSKCDYNDLRMVAAFLSPDLQSAAQRMLNHAAFSEKTFLFLLQIPGLKGGLALQHVVGNGNAKIIQELMEKTFITTDDIHSALFRLLNKTTYSSLPSPVVSYGNKSEVGSMTLLFSRSDINIDERYQSDRHGSLYNSYGSSSSAELKTQSIAEQMIGNPDYIPLLIQHPSATPALFYQKIQELLQQRAALLADALLPLVGEEPPISATKLKKAGVLHANQVKKAINEGHRWIKEQLEARSIRPFDASFIPIPSAIRKQSIIEKLKHHVDKRALVIQQRVEKIKGHLEALFQFHKLDYELLLSIAEQTDTIQYPDIIALIQGVRCQSTAVYTLSSLSAPSTVVSSPPLNVTASEPGERETTDLGPRISAIDPSDEALMQIQLACTLSELTQQRDILHARMDGSQSSKEEATYRRVLARMVSLEAKAVSSIGAMAWKAAAEEKSYNSNDAVFEPPIFGRGVVANRAEEDINHSKPGVGVFGKASKASCQ